MVSVYPILPLLRVRCLLGVLVGGGFVLLYRSFFFGCWVWAVRFRGGFVIYTFSSCALGVRFVRSAFAVVSYFSPRPSLALGIGFDRPAFAVVSYLSSPSFVRVGHWVWPSRFRGGFVAYPVGASRWLGGLSKQKDRIILALGPFP